MLIGGQLDLALYVLSRATRLSRIILGSQPLVKRCLWVFLFITHVSIAPKTNHYLGRCKGDKQQPRRFNQTLTGTKLPGVVGVSESHVYVTGTEVCLLNGDKCIVGQHVIVQSHRPDMSTFVACLREIIQQVGSQNHNNSKPDGLLLETVDSSSISQKFQMPRLRSQNEWSFVPISVGCACACRRLLY